MTSIPPRPNADVGSPGTWAMEPSGGKCRIGVVVPLLILGLPAALSVAQQGPGPIGKVRGIRATNRQVLVGPEKDPFNMPSDVAVGPEGDVYVLDGVHHRVVVYDADGGFRLQFGAQGSSPGQLLHPLGITTSPDGKVCVADSGNHRVQVFTPDGRPLEVIPLPTSGLQAAPDPTDVAVDPARQRLYIADNDNHHVLVYSLANHRFEAVWGTPGQGQRQFRFPFLIDFSSDGYLFVVEPINTRVQVLNSSGKFVRFVGGWGVRPGQLFRPKGVAVWGNRVLVTDSYLGSIQAFNLDGCFLGVLTDAAGAPMKFTTPTGIAIDAGHRRLYVVELKANQICRMDLE